MTECCSPPRRGSKPIKQNKRRDRVERFRLFCVILQGDAVFENGDLPVAVAFVLGFLPICGAQNQIEEIVRGGRLGIQIDPAGLFLCQGNAVYSPPTVK